jgi:hypothetical protein
VLPDESSIGACERAQSEPFGRTHGTPIHARSASVSSKYRKGMHVNRLALASAFGVFLGSLAFVACGNSADPVPGLGLGATGGAGRPSGSGGSPSAGSSGASTGSGGSSATGATGGTITVPVGPVEPPDAGGPCEGLQCQQTTCTMGACVAQACTGGAVTTVTGIVHEPAGKIPLYNVVVYVPNEPVPAITTGASCDRCELTVVNPVVSAITDTHGKFVLNDVPVGNDIPLVIQVGKWRRQITIPTVTPCTENVLSDVDQTRLPRNQAEGNIPLIAITTGGLDSMECLPRRMGIDDAEFTTDQGNGRIHLYAGPDLAPGGGMMGGGTAFYATKAFDPTVNAGATFTPATDLWAGLPTLQRYDLVILSCEGSTFEDIKPPASRQALYDYASIGGRVFASHWHHVWFSQGPAPVPGIGTWADREDPQSPATGTINTSFPKGQALADWLVNVGASTTAGEFEIIEGRDNIQAVTSAEATEWITLQNANESRDPTAVEYLSFNTPLGVAEEQKCGRMVYTDLHVSATGADRPGDPFPSECEVRDLTAQEKAVMFMLFDLSSCIMNDDDPPEPPGIIK